MPHNAIEQRRAKDLLRRSAIVEDLLQSKKFEMVDQEGA